MIEFVQAACMLRTPVLVGYAGFAIFLTVIAGVSPVNFRQNFLRWFPVVSLIVLVILRVPTILVNAPLNPDEAQSVAAAMKLYYNMNTWLSVDIGSNGPVNSYLLMWPFLFGADTGFAAARITAVFLLGSTWLLFWIALKSAPTSIRISSSAGLILVLGGTQTTDFIHYASEIPSSFLIMAALVVALIAVERRPGAAQICIAGLCLGLVPFVKVQAAIIAVVLGAILLWQVMLKASRPYWSALLLLICACLPAAVLLLPLAAAGGLYDFWASYIGFARNYVAGGWGEVTPYGILPPRLHALARILYENLPGISLAATAMVTALALLIRQVVGRRPRLRMLLRQPEGRRVAIVFFMLGVSLWAVIAPARPFPHYAFLLLWPAMLAAGLMWSLQSAWPAREGVGRWSLHGVAAGLSVLIIGALAVREPRLAFDPDVIAVESVFTAGSPLAGRDAAARALVWGWMPEWYVWSGWIPATRDITSYSAIVPTPARHYYRERMMADLQSSPPDYIIDGVARGSFAFTNPEKEGLTSFPELAAFVSADYVLLSRAPSDTACPKVFARKATAETIARRYVDPSRVYASSTLETGAAVASASHVVDGLVFESCADAWLLPDGKLGEITLELAPVQSIAAIEILNTRGGWRGNRAAKKARVMAYQDGNMVIDQELRLLRFPNWTQIVIPDDIGPIGKLVVRIDSYAGVGGGLNEVRLRKR